MRALLVVLLIAGAVAGGGVAGYLIRDTGDETRFDVTVREGAPPLGDGVDAVLTVDLRLIAAAAAGALAEAELPVLLEEVAVEPVAEGLRITGRASLEVAGVDVSGDFETVAVPVPGDGGCVDVMLGDSTVEGVSVPEPVERELSAIVGAEVCAQTEVPGYRVLRIETSVAQHFISFAEAGPGP